MPLLLPSFLPLFFLLLLSLLFSSFSFFHTAFANALFLFVAAMPSFCRRFAAMLGVLRLFALPSAINACACFCFSRARRARVTPLLLFSVKVHVKQRHAMPLRRRAHAGVTF